jgi:flagella basal body P-ring formation protein FlgA
VKAVQAFAILFILFSFNVNALSYTRIYLMSDIEVNKENVTVSDICKMEGENINLISEMIISPELYSDDIIDNKELYDFLSAKINDKLFIFGSGVKIKKNNNIEIEQARTILIKKGEMIGLLIKKNGITIEMKGRALSSGAENDEIDIRLSTGKIMKGRITADRKADVAL